MDDRIGEESTSPCVTLFGDLMWILRSGTFWLVSVVLSHRFGFKQPMSIENKSGESQMMDKVTYPEDIALNPLNLVSVRPSLVCGLGDLSGPMACHAIRIAFNYG